MREEEGSFTQATRGQLIVSGNVFHLHVYTVNSGGGLSTVPFSAAIRVPPHSLHLAFYPEGGSWARKVNFCRQKCFSLSLLLDKT